MSQMPLQSRRILGLILLLFAIFFAVVLYLLVGVRALAAGSVGLIGETVMGVLLLAGWPWRTKK